MLGSRVPPARGHGSPRRWLTLPPLEQVADGYRAMDERAIKTLLVP